MSDLEKNTCDIEIPSDGNAIVVIGNPEICAPCRKLDEYFEKNRSKIDARILNIDVGDFKKTFPHVDVLGIPKILFMQSGKVVLNFDGFPGENALDEILEMAFR